MKQKTYLLDEGIKKLTNLIQKKLLEKDESILILIAGGSASGKTSAVAKKIKDYFSDSQILSMDNYYRGRAYYEENGLNFDQPEALDLDLFFKHLTKLKNGKKVKIPEYDFKVGEPKYDKIELKPSRIIIVEGLFALHEKLEKLGDFKVFVDLGINSQILRRLFRDVDRTGDKPQNILTYFLDVVYKMHKKYIEPTKKNADIFIINDYIPEIESKNAKIKEDRLKYKFDNKNPKEILSELIYKMGGSYVGKTEQVDYFFDPKGKYKDTDELLLIRKIGFERYFFMYFGPDDKSTFYDDRYTMKFFTDYKTFQFFKKLYPEHIFESSKIRRSFFIDGILVCLDNFEGGETYIVFKFENTKNNDKTISKILKNLGVSKEKDLLKQNFYQFLSNS